MLSRTRPSTFCAPTGIWSADARGGNRHAGCECAAIAGQENGGGVALALDRAGQGTENVAEPAGLGERHRFRGDKGHMHP